MKKRGKTPSTNIKMFGLRKIGKKKKKDFNTVSPFLRILAEANSKSWCTIMCNISPQVFKLIYECILNAAYNSEFFTHDDRENLKKHMSKHVSFIYNFLHCNMSWFERQCCCLYMYKQLQYIFKVILPYIDDLTQTT